MIEWAIIGGGIHGTYVANRLLEQTSTELDSIQVIDPEPALLASFTRKARRCGMQTLRSPLVHHVGAEPFSLRAYADAHGRENELVTTNNNPRRPSLDLFLDHAHSVIDRRNLPDCHLQARVTAVRNEGGALWIETDSRPLLARRCVLAIGSNPNPVWPGWALDCGRLVTHVWGPDFEATALGGENVIVIGGGITAAQVACRLTAHANHVTLLSRRPLQRSAIEAHPQWVGWEYIRKHLHQLSSGSKARHECIRTARNDGTVPPYVLDRLRDHHQAGALEIAHGRVADVTAMADGLDVRFRSGASRSGVRVVLATGISNPYRHPLAARLIRQLHLETGHKSMPILDDATLEWERTNGERSNVFVTGTLAEGSVGPFARNIIGARRAAERILTAETDAMAVARS